jgi:hypothetical protein
VHLPEAGGGEDRSVAGWDRAVPPPGRGGAGGDHLGRTIDRAIEAQCPVRPPLVVDSTNQPPNAVPVVATVSRPSRMRATGHPAPAAIASSARRACSKARHR